MVRNAAAIITAKWLTGFSSRRFLRVYDRIGSSGIFSVTSAVESHRRFNRYESRMCIGSSSFISLPSFRIGLV
jgi:hypothetical protein